VLCDEHGIGGEREYFSDNDAHLGRVNALYHGALGGKYDAEHLVNQTRRLKPGQRLLQK
jgi:hypothetical protein